MDISENVSSNINNIIMMRKQSLRMPRPHELEFISQINEKKWKDSCLGKSETCSKCQKICCDQSDLSVQMQNNFHSNLSDFDSLIEKNSIFSVSDLDLDIMSNQYCQCGQYISDKDRNNNIDNDDDVEGSDVDEVFEIPRIIQPKMTQPNMIKKPVEDTTENDQFINKIDSCDIQFQYHVNVDINEQYDFKEILGKGKFAVVNRVVLKSQSTDSESQSPEYAAKQLIYRTEQSKRRILDEIEILKELDKENCHVMTMFEVYECSTSRPRTITMIMELLSGGELFEELIKDEYLTEEKVIQIIRQIISGVQFIHSKQIIHRDLKPENIVYQTSNSVNLKIIDFGFAVKYDGKNPPKSMVGTTVFAAPEVFRFENQSFETDMWSVGILAYNLLAGITPFEIPRTGDRNRELQESEIIQNIERCEYDFDDEGFEGVSQAAKDFIQLLLVRKPGNRLSATKCLQNPWLNCDTVDSNGLQATGVPRSICLYRMKNYVNKWKKVKLALRTINQFMNTSTN